MHRSYLPFRQLLIAFHQKVIRAEDSYLIPYFRLMISILIRKLSEAVWGFDAKYLLHNPDEFYSKVSRKNYGEHLFNKLLKTV